MCEDRQQEVFARTFLENCGITAYRVNITRPGYGSGEQYVRENYPEEVRLFRGKFPAQPNTCLVVLIDADVLEVTECLNKLKMALRKSGMSERMPKERIAVFIPKRNIETWIHFLMGESVNEEEEFRKNKKESICKPFVENLAHNRKNTLPGNAPPSMLIACQELSRIL